jgi:DNA gyrase/topoisomerase IV subunit B
MRLEGNLSEYKKFDLNIESILEDWDVYHALREVIANMIDKELLTNSDQIRIELNNGDKN